MTWQSFKKQMRKTNEEYFINNIDNSLGRYVVDELIEISNRIKRNNWNDLYDLDEKNWATLHDIYVHSNIVGCSIAESVKWQVGVADGGVDSFWIDEINNELILIQTKLKKIKANSIDRMKTVYDEYLRGSKDISANDKGLKKIIEKMKGKKIIGAKYIAVEPKINKSGPKENNVLMFGWDKMLKDSIQNISKQMTLTLTKFLDDHDRSAVKSFTNRNTTSIVIRVKVKDLAEEISNYNKIAQGTLFNSNVRSDVRTNDFKSGFKMTLEDNPSNFEIFNNGITIIVKELDVDIKNICLKNPQIINGQQTTRTLLDIHNKDGLPEDAYVHIKIIQTDNDNLIMDIAKYSNKQSAIKTGDLISTTTAFKKLSEKAYERGYYLIAKQGKSEQKTILTKMQLKIIDVKDVIKFYIVKNKPEKMAQAKAQIGKLQSEFIKTEQMEMISRKDIEEAFRIKNIKSNLIKEFKERVMNESIKGSGDTNKINELIKEKNRIWSFADIAIIKMIFDKKDKDVIYEKLSSFRDEYKKDSLIQSFKKDEAYISLGLIDTN